METNDGFEFAQRPKSNISLSIEDLDTGNVVKTKLEFYQDDTATIRERIVSEATSIAKQMGYTEEKKMNEQDQDLDYQKPEETDNLQKSERPADDYMDSRGLDHETHGKKPESTVSKQ